MKLTTVALLAFALSACGGSVVGAPADGGLRGSSPGDATPDAIASCPSAGTLSPGGTCEAENQTCPATFTCGCGDSLAISCTCSDGQWLCATPSCGGCSPSCPNAPTPGQTCSFPVGRRCPGVLSCPGGFGAPIDLECMAGVWTRVSKDACAPHHDAG